MGSCASWPASMATVAVEAVAVAAVAEAAAAAVVVAAVVVAAVAVLDGTASVNAGGGGGESRDGDGGGGCGCCCCSCVSNLATTVLLKAVPGCWATAAAGRGGGRLQSKRSTSRQAAMRSHQKRWRGAPRMTDIGAAASRNRREPCRRASLARGRELRYPWYTTALLVNLN